MTYAQTFDRAYMDSVSDLESLVQYLFMPSFGDNNRFEMWVFNISINMIVPVCFGLNKVLEYSNLYFKTWLNFDVRYKTV